MEEIKFYKRRYRDKINYADYTLPCFILTPIKSWNDYSHVTRHTLQFIDEDHMIIHFGEIKILQKGSKETDIPEQFIELDSLIYCSLAQSVNFYFRIMDKFNQEECEILLTKLNDVAYCIGIREDFKELEGFKNSLLRNSEAEKAYNEGKRIIEGIEIENAFKFTFDTRIDIEEDHSVNFDFSRGQLPYRITAIIGKNGTGKTQYLARLANTLSGLKEEGSFNPHRPVFSKIIAVSYSLFDIFKLPYRTKTFSYVYCGMRHSDNRIMSDDDLNEKIKKAIKKIDRRGFLNDWFRLISDMIDFDAINIGSDELIENRNIIMNEDGTSKLSSGQSIILYVFAEIFANIENESLILFDEPETHLHPNAIARLVKALNKLLEKFNSYAILTTHSPIIVQEIPSEYVYTFKRSQNEVKSEKLNFESFGENLTEITERIFNTISIEQNYKTILDELSTRLNYEDICEIFSKNGKELSFNAKIYLQSIYN